MIKKLLLLAIIAGGCSLHGPGLSRHEKGWALLHPIAALKVKRIASRAAPVYKGMLASNELDPYANGGRLDAFRHVFYMAAFAQQVPAKKLRRLGRAHEKGNYRQFLRAQHEEGEVPDSLSSVMDLQNNELGLRLGKENKSLELQQLRDKAVTAIKQGEAVIMKRNRKGEYMDCEGRVLKLSKTIQQWNLPKCLVPSDYVYKD